MGKQNPTPSAARLKEDLGESPLLLLSFAPSTLEIIRMWMLPHFNSPPVSTSPSFLTEIIASNELKKN